MLCYGSIRGYVAKPTVTIQPEVQSAEPVTIRTYIFADMSAGDGWFALEAVFCISVISSRFPSQLCLMHIRPRTDQCGICRGT